MAIVGPNFPKCPACKKDMVSVGLEDVPTASRREMARYNRYQALDPNYWYKCETDGIYIHKLALQAK